MYSNNVAIELLAATPFKHNVTGTGGVTTKVGETKQLPPTLSLQYHFNPTAKFKPYVGAGINYTIFFDEKATATITSLKLKRSFGLAAQVGFDYQMQNDWFLNADLRYINIETTASTSLGTTELKINPWVISIGFGKRF